MLAAVRGWVRDHSVLALAVYASLFALWASVLVRPVLLVNDGHMYFEMARSMRHGSLEVQNGLDLVDSPELWMQNAVKRGPHVYAKYPPLYALLAVGPVAAFGIRGLYLLNAVAFVATMLAVFALARRVLAPGRALLATAVLPFGLPLVPYMLMELPHLTALAPLLWGLVFWDDARQADEPRRAWLRGLAAGLLVGLSFGVRLQNVVFMAPILGLGALHARRRGALVGGVLFGFAACAIAVGAFNVPRFGSANPFSYGPANSEYGVPHPEDGMGVFLRPAFLATAALALGAFLFVRVSAHRLRWLALPAAVAAIAAVPPLREVGTRSAGTVGSLLLNAGIAGAGWSDPDRTFGWINKSLLSCVPFLVLGFVAVFRGNDRRDPPLLSLFAWMTVVLLVFLSVREPDPRTMRGAMGFMSLSPRYLVEAMPILYLLAWDRLRDVPIRLADVGLGVFAGVALAFFFHAMANDDLEPAKAAVITTASITAAALLVVAYEGRALAPAALALGPLLALTTGYAAACAYAEDAHALREMAATDERWGRRVLAAMPEPMIAQIGWLYAKDPIFHLRASKSIVTVDPYVDDGASLADTLDVLTDHGRTAYYFGLGLERAAPRVEGRYRVVPVLDDPLLWRFERIR